MNIAIKEMQINEEIRDKELRVIMGDGEVLGIMSADEALRIAEEKEPKNLGKRKRKGRCGSDYGLPALLVQLARKRRWHFASKIFYAVAC